MSFFGDDIVSAQPMSAWLFPGQGSQEVGMGRALFSAFPKAEEVFALAEEYSGLPLRTVSQRGPEPTLVRTDYLQPTLVALSVAFVDFLKAHGKTPSIVAGHSLGELSALYAAEVLSIHDVLRLAAKRGSLMSQSASGGMMAVKDLDIERIEALIQECQEGVVVAANFNSPNQLVISGEETALDAMLPRLANCGGTCVRLNVQGAWHSPLVSSAADAFKTDIDSATFHPPKCKLFMGMTAKSEDDPERIRELLKSQICSPVRWYELVQAIADVGVTDFLECGPGKVLRGLMRKIFADANRYEIAGVDNSKFIKDLANSGAVR